MEPSQLYEENENEKSGKNTARSRKMFPDNLRRFPNFPFLTLSNGYSFNQGNEDEKDDELISSESEEFNNPEQFEQNKTTMENMKEPSKAGNPSKKSRLKESCDSGFKDNDKKDKRECLEVHVISDSSSIRPIQRDAQKAGTFTIYPQGYHIAWKGNSKGKDCLHDPDGHRYCYYVNEGSNYCKPTDREAYWQCSGRGALTKRPCGVIVREMDGIFSQYSIKEHLSEPHLPKGSSFNNCEICVERHGIQ